MSADPLELARRSNERMMMAHGIEVGQVRAERSRRVAVLAPADYWPRNGKGLVRCTTQWGDNEAEETHYWPETLARFPVAEHSTTEEGATDV